jgi:hypothetical protein
MDKPDTRPWKKEEPIVHIRLHPKQALVLKSPANEILFGGAAGPGKSFLVRAAAIGYCTAIPGLQAYLFRRTYPELWSTHMEGPGSFRVLLAKAVASGAVAIVKNEIRFSNGSRISLNHCQYEANKYNFQGAEIHMLAIDELTHFPRSVYTYLRTRCRLGTLRVPDNLRHKFPFILSTTNPGGAYHNWVKEDFVEYCGTDPYVVKQMPEEEGGMRRSFIPAFYSDNPDLLKNDPEYLGKLKGAGDPETVRSLVYGDWDVVSGAMFSSGWVRNRNVCAPMTIPAGWELWRGADDGYANPACVLWFARDPILDRTYAIGELYRAGMLPEEMARLVLERDKMLLIEEPDGSVHELGHTLEGLIDPASFANTGTGAPARGDAMNKLGTRWRAADKYSGSRVHGIHHIHRMLAAQKDGWPKLVIFETCQQLARALPTAPRDAHNPEDIDPEFELDHAIDALRYGLQWRSASGKRVRLSGI